MNHYDHQYLSVCDMETIEKIFEQNILPAAQGNLQTGEPGSASSKRFIEDYNKDYNKVFASNNLSEKTKVLIALAVAAATYRPYCIDTYCNDALEHGWSCEQVKEAVEISAAVKSGFSSLHAVQKMNDNEVMAK